MRAANGRPRLLVKSDVTSNLAWPLEGAWPCPRRVSSPLKGLSEIFQEMPSGQDCSKIKNGTQT